MAQIRESSSFHDRTLFMATGIFVGQLSCILFCWLAGRFAKIDAVMCLTVGVIAVALRSTIFMTIAYYGDEKILKLGNEADPGKYRIDIDGAKSMQAMESALENHRRSRPLNLNGGSSVLDQFQMRNYLLSDD